MPRKKQIRHVRNSGRRRAMRFRLAEAQNWRCCYCGCECGHETATIEHVIPLADGGEDRWMNLAMCCSPCNLAKSLQFQETIKKRARMRR